MFLAKATPPTAVSATPAETIPTIPAPAVVGSPGIGSSEIVIVATLSFLGKETSEPSVLTVEISPSALTIILCA